jgi:glycosyltransferase involved in cell wall biosynthesis
MTRTIEVSAIIPTFNRRQLVTRAIDSALAQTVPIDEIVVIDDGSTDGTDALLLSRYGDRIRYHWQPNAGVSAARNRGMAMARGRHFALLDSDDIWLPQKTAVQLQLLRDHPDFGLALCDVVRTDSDDRDVEIFHRREVIRQDGWVLRWIIHHPALVPASVLMKREVYEDIGGFDETLRTAEDLDFHLRAARRWQIGVVEQPLVRALRGHDDGLSATAGTYDDYLRVIERAIAEAADSVPPAERNRALAGAYARNARGMLMHDRRADAWRLARKAWGLSDDDAIRRQLLALLPFAVRRMLSGVRRRLGT